ncbi:MAG: IS200/IS605 family transposase [Clostridiales bacterium]|nr:IS200/IS605 family transposase [Clostridiales bacterium]
MFVKKEGEKYYKSRHSCFLLQYHMVFVTKYRNPVLTGDVKDSVYSTIRATCESRNCHILEMNGEPDHIHLLYEAGPELAPQELANVLKTKTARFARRDYPDEVKKHYWKPYFWKDGYFVITASENSLDIVRRYIQNQ